MKLKDEFVKFPKEIVYDMYLSLVYDFLKYDDITRSKMIDSILDEYNNEQYLYYICTEKELKFLKYAFNKKLDTDDIKKYEWEINELNKKCIFSKVKYEVFIEQKENVKIALEQFNKRPKKGEDEIIIFMISIIKTNAQMLTKVLKGLVEDIFNIEEEKINRLLGHPLFNFYCEFDREWFELSNKYEEIISYREYYDMLDDIKELRKEFGIAGNKYYYLKDYYDIFYYGFPIRNEKVKKMYDEINKKPDKELLFKLVDISRVLYDRCGLCIYIEDEKLLKIINEALDETPCAVMNGFTPNEYELEREKEFELEKKFSVVPQDNAHLSKKAADEYYKLYFALLDYINKIHKITPSLKRIYKQEELNAQDLIPIDKYLWTHKEIIDEFTEKNEYKFTEEELEKIKNFKSAVSSDKFIVIGFEKEYTKVLSEDGKIYMVKGIRSDLNKIINPTSLPKIIKTTLLMFDGYIIYNSFLSAVEVMFGNNVNESILQMSEKAMTYYHL